MKKWKYFFAVFLCYTSLVYGNYSVDRTNYFFDGGFYFTDGIENDFHTSLTGVNVTNGDIIAFNQPFGDTSRGNWNYSNDYAITSEISLKGVSGFLKTISLEGSSYTGSLGVWIRHN